MKFFDPKEEVLDIQLTRYGRHKISVGKWKPAYYAFFDDNVLYDLNYGGVSTENRNDAETRIQDETPLLKTQHSFTGLESYLFDEEEDIKDWIRHGVYEKMTVMPLSLGTSSPGSTKTPAYKIQFLDGKIDSVEFNITGNVRVLPDQPFAGPSQQLLKIPQIESDIEFKVTVFDTAGTQPRFETDPALIPGNIYTDDMQVAVGPAQILLLLEEKNASFDYENFDIEVFEITGTSGSLGEPVLRQLSFIKPVEMVKDNLLLDLREARKNAGQPNGLIPELDPTYVNYYFDVNVDSEIDENILCKAVSELGSKKLLVDLDVECPDLFDPLGRSIYSSDAEIDDCPDL
jgi:hypothetical protein